MGELICAECLEVCPDVALGIADAEERARVLAHVERCRACGDELASLSEVADLLCMIPPPVDPPRGFASRVVSTIIVQSRHGQRAPSSRRRSLRPLAVAASVVLAAAIGVGGWLAAGGGGGGGSKPSATLETAPLVSHHRRIGQVMVVPGDKLWMTVAVHPRAATRIVRCEIEDAAGRWRTMGTFDVYHGRGYWAAALPHGLVVRKAELTTVAGHVLATASLAQAPGKRQ